MIDVCVPFEDFEYNAVGNFRCYFIILEAIVVVYLSVLFSRMPNSTSSTRLYVQNLIMLSWPLIPFRLCKIIYIFYDPINTSQSGAMCLLLRGETTLQYAFSLAHVQTLAVFSIYAVKNRNLSSGVTTKLKRLLFSLNVFALLISIIFVNLQFSNGLFACLYTMGFTIAFTAHFIMTQAALFLNTCCSFWKRKENDSNNFSYWWMYMLQSIMTFAHLYQLSGLVTFLIPKIFTKFDGDYLLMFRYITGALSVKFMVSITFAVGPILILPPVRRQIFKPIKKIYQDRVVPIPEDRSPEQVQITLH